MRLGCKSAIEFKHTPAIFHSWPQQAHLCTLCAGTNCSNAIILHCGQARAGSLHFYIKVIQVALTHSTAVYDVNNSFTCASMASQSIVGSSSSKLGSFHGWNTDEKAFGKATVGNCTHLPDIFTANLRAAQSNWGFTRVSYGKPRTQSNSKSTTMKQT